jgi:hypothetical protein
MDMREFSGSSFVKYDDVVDAPIEGLVKAIEPGKFGRPVLALEEGQKLSLNTTNVNAQHPDALTHLTHLPNEGRRGRENS